PRPESRNLRAAKAPQPGAYGGVEDARTLRAVTREALRRLRHGREARDDLATQQLQACRELRSQPRPPPQAPRLRRAQHGEGRRHERRAQELHPPSTSNLYLRSPPRSAMTTAMLNTPSASSGRYTPREASSLTLPAWAVARSLTPQPVAALAASASAGVVISSMAS